MVRVIQISDTHLGRHRAHFVENWQPLKNWLASENPNLIIHSGDISVDGADVEDDFAFCREVMVGLPAPMLVVPGNHDVGEPQSAHQPTNEHRLERWNRQYGADFWAKDVGAWRLLGFDSMILSSGLAAEEAQFHWLERQMESADGRRIAWFTHQPLFINGWDDIDNGYWSVRPEPRTRLQRLTQRFGVDLIANGHLHLSHDFVLDGVQFVWCPSAAFAVGPDMQPPLGGEKQLGAVRYEFSDAGFTFERIHLPELTMMWIDDVVHEVYPPR
ncbi:metallophosphoesterase family protein [Brucella pecoris]|uniref:3',5'-cyclic AMP phosphodiesterase CpdA n=1 Tax=Brucella pecoris TaxID=867683 RepID=A0A5C5CQD9_9HYPH|nr:metallophosphoesterase [Brucella pecoris]MBB4093114.1 3',5'-cyclic AMP phosphodiesterase CpdA [Brucella pecoris]TNV13364.1 metallophosphoesterase [Brucella pecoris]